MPDAATLQLAERFASLQPLFPAGCLARYTVLRKGDAPKRGTQPQATDQFLKDFLALFRVEGFDDETHGGWFSLALSNPLKITVRVSSDTRFWLIETFLRECERLGTPVMFQMEWDLPRRPIGE